MNNNINSNNMVNTINTNNLNYFNNNNFSINMTLCRLKKEFELCCQDEDLPQIVFCF